MTAPQQGGTTGRVALATCRKVPELDEDDRLLIPALAALGVAAEPAGWDDQRVDWSAFDLVVVRSTWDYVDRREEFLAWARRVPRLANRAEVLRWNTDKRYLRELAGAGVPVVPTRWFTPGEAVRLPEYGRHVIKPAVGAGARDAGSFALDDPAHRALAAKHVSRLLEQGATVMLQPYLSAVDTAGESALVFFDGRFSHAIRKSALLASPDTEVAGLFRPEEIASRTATDLERTVAESVLAAVPRELSAGLLYARVDLIPDAQGEPLLLELELSEPSLFLGHAAGAADRFAAAVRARIGR